MLRLKFWRGLSKMTDEIVTGQKEKKGLVGRALDWYWKPRGPESDELYESLGTRFFSDYCPNMGAKFSITRPLVRGKGIEGCKDRIVQSKILEGVHWGGFGYFAYSALNNLANENYVGAAVDSVLNLLVNVYPIMSQRYNRHRAQRLVDRDNERKLGGAE